MVSIVKFHSTRSLYQRSWVVMAPDLASHIVVFTESISGQIYLRRVWYVFLRLILQSLN